MCIPHVTAYDLCQINIPGGKWNWVNLRHFLLDSLTISAEYSVKESNWKKKTIICSSWAAFFIIIIV